MCVETSPGFTIGSDLGCTVSKQRVGLCTLYNEPLTEQRATARHAEESIGRGCENNETQEGGLHDCGDVVAVVGNICCIVWIEMIVCEDVRTDESDQPRCAEVGEMSTRKEVPLNGRLEENSE